MSAPDAVLLRPSRAVLSSRLVGLGRDLGRYFLVSLAALATDAALLTLCHRVFGWHYLAAATAGFLVGLAVSYSLSLAFVYSGRRRMSASAEFTGFLATGLAGLVVTQIGMMLLVSGLGLAPEIAKVPVALATFCFNFLSRRLLFTAPAVPQTS
jgi:putative flippase GtrA